MIYPDIYLSKSGKCLLATCLFSQIVLLEHSHAFCLSMVSGCSGGPKAALSSYNRVHIIHQPVLFTAWPFKKKFADPWSKGKMPVLYKIVDSDSHSVTRDNIPSLPPHSNNYH